MPTCSTGATSRAFTLVELTVVMAIIAVLAAMIVPQLAGRSSSMELEQAARDLLLAARYAREYAATRRCECQLRIDASAGRYALARADAAADSSGEFVALKTAVVKPKTLPPQVRFGRVRITSALGRDVETSNCITFRPDGRCDAAVAEITNGRRVYSLIILPDSGRAKLVEGAVTEPPDERIDLDA